jgi:hypothetical protein
VNEQFSIRFVTAANSSRMLLVRVLLLNVQCDGWWMEVNGVQTSGIDGWLLDTGMTMMGDV